MTRFPDGGAMPEPTAVACSYPIPGNELERLRALLSYEILDTPPEPGFDAVTHIATQALNAPISVVGLLDSDRLWFKSRKGLDLEQFDRDIAFCAHAVLQPGELLIVDDLSKDERFRNNPLVTEGPNLRFYAAAPLVVENELVLGTIAIVDSRPRTLSEQERTVLRELGVLVMAVLQNRHRARLLQRMAMTDYLTGLGNRAQFEHALRAELAHADRQDAQLTLLYMDLDGFKAVNDECGHEAGDDVLRQVAARLQETARSEDIVCRMGGDEFCIITRATSTEGALNLAERIETTVSAPYRLSTGQEVHVGVSIGISTRSGELDTEKMLGHADRQLYQQKADRRNKRA